MDTGLAVAFAGTPDFALPALDALAASHHHLTVVYTQPDRPAGRGRALTPSPVKERAHQLGIPVEQPAKLSGEDARLRFAAHAPDVLVVVAYGLLLPASILGLPRFGCVNLHASLLPRWRGAAPIARAILAGDATTGVCIMRMETGLDTGPVMMRREVAIGARETAGELERRLAAEGAALLVPALDALAAGAAVFEPQDAAQATWALKLKKEEARLDWREPAAALERRVRALDPRPVAQSVLDGVTIRVWDASVVGDDSAAAPGTILSAGAGGMVVKAGQGALAIGRVQLPGRRAVAAADFANTRPLAGRVLT